MPSIGVVGCGTIAQALLTAIQELDSINVAGVYSRTASRAKSFLQTLSPPPPYLELPELIEQSDIVVEAASGSVVPELAKSVFAMRKDLVIASIGALLEHPEIIELARSSGSKLYAPSGAIVGLDGLKSATVGKIDQVVMTSKKPPNGLAGSPYLLEHGISLENITVEKEVFFGNALEAARGFPSNLNVAAAVSIAGIGFERTMVRLLAVPGLKRNCHEIHIEGEFGTFNIAVENVPSDNPRTSRLAVFSIIRTVRDLQNAIQIGN